MKKLEFLTKKLNKMKVRKNVTLGFKLPYARHYKPRLLYFFTPFPKTIYLLWPLALCMACIQEWLLIKSGLWWRAYGIWTLRKQKSFYTLWIGGDKKTFFLLLFFKVYNKVEMSTTTKKWFLVLVFGFSLSNE